MLHLMPTSINFNTRESSCIQPARRAFRSLSPLLAAETPVPRNSCFWLASSICKVLRGLTYDLRTPSKGEVRVRFRLSPQNPADLNVIQGSYPERPKPRQELSHNGEDIFIGGNEGLAVVEHVPSDTDTSLKEGDWVIMGRPQLGTWTSHSNILADSLFPLPKSSKLTEVQAATVSINPGTAFRMLKDFVNLKEGDWVVQNGANSQVGLAVIQLAEQWGIKTLNFVRDRENMASLRGQLAALGADQVFTYSQLAEKSFKSDLAKKIGQAPLKLALNCVGGKDTSNMAKLLGKDAQLVTYGAMSMQPLSLPSSLFIFKNLTSSGFWMTTWYNSCTSEQRGEMTQQLVHYLESGALKAPECEIVDLIGSEDDFASRAVQAIRETKGKKVVFRFPDA